MSGGYYPRHRQASTCKEILKASGERLGIRIVSAGMVIANVDVQPQGGGSGTVLCLTGLGAEPSRAEPAVSAQVNELNQVVRSLPPCLTNTVALLGYEGMITSGENTFKKSLDIRLRYC